MIKVVIGVLMLTVLNSISIPLSPMMPRCMIGYTIDQDENLKMDVNLPPLPGQTPNEIYQISTYNTETHETTYENITNGVFKKQIPMDKSVIYRFCFKIVTNRQIGTILIDYNSELKFERHGAKAEIPEGLLKVSELKQTYNDATEMEELVSNYKKSQSRRDEWQVKQYQDSMNNASKLEIISYVEVAVIVLTGIYQFYTLRKFLVDKQYL